MSQTLLNISQFDERPGAFQDGLSNTAASAAAIPLGSDPVSQVLHSAQYEGTI